MKTRLKIFSDEYSSEDINNLVRKKDKKHRITPNFITKFEKSRILGIRALQISNGSPVFIRLKGETDPFQVIEIKKIALKEYKLKKIPFKIRRYLPNGHFEDYHLSELIDLHE
uniref:DNA-directed RNA polymerase I, II and III n=1 Tax=Amorphochlora amoebiformis TaxID=1561963 RepID=A0A0H5BHN6_9EUKA|nr:DNA-directed RNA polymerase I, II and III [Amorphochlora amoebiformis]|mmetsp:Transcript_3634/g.5596  ORF Transcript_3634/g.5596 Transcript_3634/m.5596 type:complete len:113 (+) Transcript_3634:331-669(+)